MKKNVLIGVLVFTTVFMFTFAFVKMIEADRQHQLMQENLKKGALTKMNADKLAARVLQLRDSLQKCTGDSQE